MKANEREYFSFVFIFFGFLKIFSKYALQKSFFVI